MKRMMLLLATLFIAGAVSVNAQENKQEEKNPIFGLWQYVEERVAPDGTVQYIGKPKYKSINQDKTYFAMMSVTIDISGSEKEKPYTVTETFITQTGEIELNDDGSYLEYIGEHYTNPSLTNTISIMRYEFNKDNPNVMYIEYLTANNENTWFSETWLRVQPLGSK